MKHLTEEQKVLLEMVRDVADREIAPLAIELDEKHAFPEHAQKLFAELGLLNPLLPAEHGGTEMENETFVMILEEIGRVCASTTVFIIDSPWFYDFLCHL